MKPNWRGYKIIRDGQLTRELYYCGACGKTCSATLRLDEKLPQCPEEGTPEECVKYDIFGK